MTEWTAPYDEGPEVPDLLDSFRAFGRALNGIRGVMVNTARQNGKLLISDQMHSAMVNAGFTAEQLSLISTICRAYEPDRQQVPKKGNHGPRRGQQFDHRGRRRW